MMIIEASAAAAAAAVAAVAATAQPQASSPSVILLIQISFSFPSLSSDLPLGIRGALVSEIQNSEEEKDQDANYCISWGLHPRASLLGGMKAGSHHCCHHHHP